MPRFVLHRIAAMIAYTHPCTYHSGPDAQGTVKLQEGNYCLSFNASELRLRGDSPISQPHKDDQGNILCWNGEVRDEFTAAQGIRYGTEYSPNRYSRE